MSKAFTKEDDAPDPGTSRRLPSPLPPGAKNYITPEGAVRLREELERLLEKDRPAAAALVPAAASGASAGAARTAVDPKDLLAAIDARIDHLRRSLESAVIVPPPRGEEDAVRFGATVTVVSPGGATARYRIVGVDEADPDHGWISWVSPIAKALLGRKVGDAVVVSLPSGEREMEIVDVGYEAPSTAT